MTRLTKEKLREGGRKRWEGVSPEERSRAMKRARRKMKFRARKALQDKAQGNG